MFDNERRGNAAEKYTPIQWYLSAELVAIVPTYTSEVNTVVHTGKGPVNEARSIPWLLRLLCKYYLHDVGYLRRYYGQLLGQQHNIPLPLASSLVLLPIKTRAAIELGETTHTQIALDKIGTVAAIQHANYAAKITATNGLEFYTINGVETIEKRIRQARTVLKDFKQHTRQDILPGLTVEQLQGVIPSCDCVLKTLLERLIAPNI